MSDERSNLDEPATGAEGDASPGGDQRAEGPGGESRQQGERPLTDEERAALLREQLKRLRVIDVVYDMMVQLVQLGYQKLGLTEETRELRNLDDARVAVEALRRLIEVAEGEGAAELSSLHSTLAQLQLSYARAAQAPADAETAPSGERPTGPSEAESPPTVEGDDSPTMEPEEAPAEASQAETDEAVVEDDRGEEPGGGAGDRRAGPAAGDVS